MIKLPKFTTQSMYDSETDFNLQMNKERISKLLWPNLRIIKNPPPPGHKVTIEVVEIITLEADVHVAVEGIAGVIGVLPLPPPVFGEQLLGQVPALHRRVERADLDG